MSSAGFDLLIVGSGPAGTAAALTAYEHGLSVVVVDEAPLVAPIVTADDHEASGLTRLVGASVFMLENNPDKQGFDVGVSCDGKAQLYHARTVLIAAGAMERPFPIPGCALPGVMTAGAAQALLSKQAVVPTRLMYLAGTGPLLYEVAARHIRAGVAIEAVLDITPRSNLLASLRYLPDFLINHTVRDSLSLLREVRNLTPIVRGVTSLEALGEGSLSGVRWSAGGRTFERPAQTLVLHQGMVPQIHLAMSAGVQHSWRPERLAFEPDQLGGRTSVRGLYLAGDCAGIAGADAAQRSGVVAAIAICEDLGVAVKAGLKATVAQALNKATRGRRFLDTFFRPPDAFRIPSNDVMICSCESVTAGEIRALTKRGAQGPNQAKAFSRAGMGPCQGRLCGLTVCEIMSETRGCSPGEIGHMRIRAPIKPITVAEMASMGSP